MRVYLDHSATTYVDPKVLEKMLPYFTEKFGNANSQHGVGREAAVAVDKARGQVAAAINAKPNEIYFTSGGSEADDWVLQGVCEANAAKGNEIIISSIEHSAMMTTAKWLEKHGVKVTYLNVDKGGFVDLEQLENAITDKTILVSVMLANNEIGTIEPIKDVVRIAKKHGVLVHTDAVQAVGSIPVDVKDLGVDFLSMSAHKFYGPKGVGALYIKNGVKIGKLLHGGEQERSMRAGTTNLASVVGMGEAIELAVKNLDENAKRITELRNYFIDGVLARIPYVRLNGDRENACLATQTSASNISKAKAFCSAWIWRASKRLRALRAQAVRWNRRTRFWPSACLSKSLTEAFASASARTTPRNKSTTLWTFWSKSLKDSEKCPRFIT